MRTRFGTTVTPMESTGEGWMHVRTEDGRVREWHISEMKFDPNDLENPIIAEAALANQEAFEAANP